MADPGQIVVLNGVPRSGKTSTAKAIQDASAGLWLNLGVDAFSRGITPVGLLPGIGLRPGGERPDLEPFVSILFDALYDSVIAQSRLGLNVIVDVGHHDDYSTPLGVLGRVSERLAERPAYFIGVRCPLDLIMHRRAAAAAAEDDGEEASYLTRASDGAIPEPVLRWERAVHNPGIYDLEIDTSEQSPGDCAQAIRARIERAGPTAFRAISERTATR